MGSFYGNVTLLGAQLDAVRELAPRPAFAFSEGDAVVLFAQADDEGAPTSGAWLSEALGCIAFSAGVHDDDIFAYEVHSAGRLVAGGAVPDPSAYFGIDEATFADVDPSLLEGLDAPQPIPSSKDPDPLQLVTALGRGDEEAVRSALEGDFVFATERHQALVDALRLPAGAVGWGYRYLANERDSYSGPSLVSL